jgi:hypothetical protein
LAQARKAAAEKENSAPNPDQTTPDGEAGGKENFLHQLLTHFNTVWKVHALITLTDKDWSKINAFLAKYPNAKHQLCFWHVLRAIKTRLAILRRVPAHYAVKSAHAEFNWIDEKFVPVSQSKEIAPVRVHLINSSQRLMLS